MSYDSWTFVVTAICAVLGYTLVSRWLNRGANTTKREESEPQKHDESEKPPKVEAWYEILGVTQNATFEEIRGGFRREIAKYHPDRVATLGPELQALAELRAKAINKAYADATRYRKR